MKIKFVILISSLYAASAVHAEGFYAVGAIGQSRFNSSHSAPDHALQASADLTANGVAGTSTNFDNLDTGYKAQLGYAFNRNFALEGGYVDFGKRTFDADYTTGSGDGEISAGGWNMDAVGTLPMTAKLSLFGEVGTMYSSTRFHVNGVDAGGAFVDTRHAHQWNPNIGLGAAYALADNTDVRFEVERFINVGRNDSTGAQNIDLMSLGVGYHFN